MKLDFVRRISTLNYFANKSYKNDKYSCNFPTVSANFLFFKENWDVKRVSYLEYLHKNSNIIFRKKHYSEVLARFVTIVTPGAKALLKCSCDCSFTFVIQMLVV